MVAELWGSFEKRHNTEPIRSDVHVVEEGVVERPPAPVVRIMLPLVTGVAHPNNYGIVNLERNSVHTSISRATLKHRLYAKYFLLGMLDVASRPALRRRRTLRVSRSTGTGGILLCGDSGAGKSTLSYACARSGWTYICDDGFFLQNCGCDGRVGTGDCYHVRFRPSAAELFPEIQGLDITPRATGKPSIELSTSPMSHVRAQSTHIDFMVFLNRRAGETPELRPYSADVARQWMRQGLYGSPESLAVQYQTIEHLLSAEVFELRQHRLGLGCRPNADIGTGGPRWWLCSSHNQARRRQPPSGGIPLPGFGSRNGQVAAFGVFYGRIFDAGFAVYFFSLQSVSAGLSLQ